MAAEAPSSLTIPDALPVLPLRGGVVVFPLSVVPLLVGQPRSIQLVDDIMRRDRLLVLVSQRGDKEQPDPDDLYRVGTAAIVHQLARLPDGKLRVVIQGLERVRLLDFVSTEPYVVARVQLAPDEASPGIEIEALRRAAVDLFRGQHLATRAFGKPFLRRVRNLLEPRGRLAINLFFDQNERDRTQRIALLFDIYKHHRVGGNIVIYARRRRG